MLNHDELIQLWTEDCKIDRTKLLERMYQSPILHSKYLTILQTYKVKIRTLTLKYQKLRMLKTRYYNGELDKAELDKQGWLQYLYKKPLKSELESLLDADGELQTIQEQILYIETMISTTESIMKELTNQHYLYKNIIEQQKFLAGA
jgi:hypothetical protein